MKRSAHVVCAVPSGVHRGVRAHHVVVGQHMGKPQLLGPLGVDAHRASVAAQFGLREYHTDLHATSRS